MGFMDELRKLTQPYEDEDDFYEGADASAQPAAPTEAQLEFENTFGGRETPEPAEEEPEAPAPAPRQEEIPAEKKEQPARVDLSDLMEEKSVKVSEEAPDRTAAAAEKLSEADKKLNDILGNRK
jgi:hypothetical protein